MRNVFCMILCVVLSLLLCESKAQVRCNVQYYTTGNGLSHDRATGIIKDSEGFIWAGSWDGINRFDGHSFQAYKSYPGDNGSLKNDRIDYIVDDNTGFLWLKGVDEFYRFDKRTELFLPVSSLIKEIPANNLALRRVNSYSKGSIWATTRENGLLYVPDTRTSESYWFHKTGRTNFLPGDSVAFLHPDNQQNIWVGTSEGLIVLTRDASGRYHSKPGNVHGRNLSFSGCSEDSENLYFSTQQGFICIFNKKTKEFNSRKVSDKRLNVLLKSRNGKELYCTTFSGEFIRISYPQFQAKTYPVTLGVPLISIFEDSSRHLWLEPRTAGTIRLNPSDGKFTWLASFNTNVLNSSNFYKVFEDRSGNVWVGTRGGAFGYYNSAANKIEYTYQDAENNIQHFPKVVFHAYYDESGILWLSSSSGVAKVILQGNKFNNQLLVPSADSEFRNEIRALLSDKKDRLWIASKKGDLTVFDEGNSIGKVFSNIPAGGLGSIYCLLEDRRDNVWIGTKFNGIFKAVPENAERTSYRLIHYNTDNSQLSHNDIFALFEDTQGIWVGTYGGGLNLIRSRGGKESFFNVKNTFSKYPINKCSKIRHITSDKDGNIWIASTGGLVVMQSPPQAGLNARFAHLTKSAFNENSLGDNDLQYIMRDSKNRMWVCTSGSGFCLATGNAFSKLSFKSFLKKDGLAGDFVLSCLEDKKGNLWIATQNGLSCFNAGANRFVNYNENDGLSKNAFSEASCCKLGNGTLVFGTMRGYLSFNPEKVSKRNQSNHIVLTGLQVNNSDIFAGAKDSLLRTNVNYAKSIKLAHNQNIISIAFSVLDHKSGGSRNLVYRLKGLNNTWQTDNSVRRATYTNLPFGDYTFEVKSMDDVYPSSEIRTLTITILPPPWRTWWAYLFYLFIFGLTVKAAFELTRTFFRLRQDVAVQRKMADLKVDFFTKVSHELRTPLTLILNPVEEVLKKESLTQQGAENIQIVKKNAERMIRFVNQWLDLRRLQSGKDKLKLEDTEIISLLRRTADYFTEISQQRKIKLRIVSESERIIAKLDAEKVEVIIYNLLANAFKYTPEGKNIEIQVDSSSVPYLKLAVVDEGIGVASDKLDDIFELYYTGQPGEINAKGTGIGLAFCKELVKLHSGKIYAENNNRGGLTVNLEIPTENNQTESIEAEETHDDVLHNEMVLDNSGFSEQEQPLVLLVEDNEELRVFLKRQLSEFYKVETAVNGADGLQKAKQLLPALILSDVMMPEMDGIQMLDNLKHDEQISHIPVVLLSAKNSVQSQIEGLQYGADLYITKPFNSDFLFAAIRSLLSKRKIHFDAIVEKKTLIELNPGELEITSKDKEFLEKVVGIVEKGMEDPSFNIDKVAELIGLGRTTFYKKFKSLTGTPPVEFVREMRLKRARQLLDAGETNVSTVAYGVGFSSAKYFSTCFREMYKMSPKEYVMALTGKEKGGFKEGS